MNINYEKIQQSINEYGNYILNCIKNQYSSSLTQEQLQNIENLLNTEFIVIEKPTKEDIEFFSKQAGITNPDDYSIMFVPSAHGGRTKGDNKIHIYPYTKSFSDCKNDEDIIESCVNSIIVHEIFHYFIRPGLSLEKGMADEAFLEFIGEGLVQYYAEEFAKKYKRANPTSNYGKNVDFVKKLIASFPSGLSQAEIDRIIFTYDIDELLKIAENGDMMYQEFVNNYIFKERISRLIEKISAAKGMSKNDIKVQEFINHYAKIDDLDVIYDDLSKYIVYVFKDNKQLRDNYIIILQKIIFDIKNKIAQVNYSDMVSIDKGMHI